MAISRHPGRGKAHIKMYNDSRVSPYCNLQAWLVFLVSGATASREEIIRWFKLAIFLAGFVFCLETPSYL